jgi:putative phage-type endonuclease
MSDFLGYRFVLNKNAFDSGGTDFHNTSYYKYIKDFIDKNPNELSLDIKKNYKYIYDKFPYIKDQDIIYNCINYHLFGVSKEHNYKISDRSKRILNYLNNLKLPEQRTEAWFKQRKGKVTASIVGAILGLEKYNTRDDILYRKLTNPSYSANKWTEHGVCFEEIVTRAYSEYFNTKVREYGLIPCKKYPWLGASPDGITEEGICIEIKCPMGNRNRGNIFDKSVVQYLCQMQLQMNICRLPYGDFVDCDIKLYKNEGECYDHNGTSRFTLDKMPRGIVGVFQHKYEDFGQNVYLYPDITKNIIDQIKDVVNQKNNISLDLNISMYDFQIKYWYIDQMIIHRIKRNKKWFEEILVPQTKEFKEEWERREKNNDLTNLKLKSYKPKKDEDNDVCMF